MDSHLSIFPNNLFLKIFPKILFYFFFSENHGNSVQTSESYFTPLFNHHVPIFFYECIPRLPSILLLCRYSVNVIIMIIVVFFDGGIFMLKPAYQLLRFSKGERLFVFQKRLLSGVKSSQKLNFRVRRSNHRNHCGSQHEIGHISRKKSSALIESSYRDVLLIQHRFADS